MSGGKQIGAIVVVAILISVGLYTLSSAKSEPHPISPSAITSKAYTTIIANGTGGDPASLFFYNFHIDRSNATFGFSWFIASATYEYFGANNYGGNPMEFSFTKVNQTLGFPYFGTFLLQPITCNVSIRFNNTTYYSIQGQPNYLAFPPNPVNKTVSDYYFTYYSPVSFTTELNNPYSNLSYASTNYYIPYISSYNLTYNIEIKPIIECGPYYVVGNLVWISHTFEYPYTGS